MSDKVHFSVLDLKAPSELHCKIIYSIVSVSSCLDIIRDSCQRNEGKRLLTIGGLFGSIQEWESSGKCQAVPYSQHHPGVLRVGQVAAGSGPIL